MLFLPSIPNKMIKKISCQVLFFPDSKENPIHNSSVPVDFVIESLHGLHVGGGGLLVVEACPLTSKDETYFLAHFLAKFQIKLTSMKERF